MKKYLNYLWIIIQFLITLTLLSLVIVDVFNAQSIWALQIPQLSRYIFDALILFASIKIWWDVEI